MLAQSERALIDEQESDLSGLFEFRRSQADGLYRRVAL
jgi:hypothetical protein